jgi:hypothetical protein
MTMPRRSAPVLGTKLIFDRSDADIEAIHLPR